MFFCISFLYHNYEIVECFCESDAVPVHLSVILDLSSLQFFVLLLRAKRRILFSVGPSLPDCSSVCVCLDSNSLHVITTLARGQWTDSLCDLHISKMNKDRQLAHVNFHKQVDHIQTACLCDFCTSKMTTDRQPACVTFT